MADHHRSGTTAPVNFNSVEFFTIQLSPLADGAVFVAMTATTVDDEEPQPPRYHWGTTYRGRSKSVRRAAA